MSLPRTTSPLKSVAEKIARDGPYKHEPAKRRVRGVLDGKCVFDTLGAEFVWEHTYYPQFYVPRDALEAGEAQIAITDDSEETPFQLGTLTIPDRPLIEIAHIDSGPLKGFVKVPFESLDSWLAEDESLPPPHPKDPYKRIECLASSRTVRIELDGIVLAESSDNIFLYETGLRVRYYLPDTSIKNQSSFVHSETETYCPYKGKANYFTVDLSRLDVVGKKAKVDDVVWFYVDPSEEVARVKGRVCFYNEKVDVFVDGVRE